MARLERIQGRVELGRPPGPWKAATNGARLDLPDQVRTGADGSAQLRLADGSLLQLGPESRLSFTMKGERLVVILEQGQLDTVGSAAAQTLLQAGGGQQVELRSGRTRFERRGKRLLARAAEASVLDLSGGGRVKMGQGAVVDLGEAEEEFQLLLEAGELEVEASKDNRARFSLRFGDSVMEVKPAAKGRITRAADGVKIQMLFGEATVDDGSARRQLTAGTRYEVDLGELEMSRLRQVETLLLDRRRYTRIRLPGQKHYRRVRRRRQPLVPGTRLRLPVRASVAMVDGPNRLELATTATGRFAGVFQDERRREGIFELERGTLRVRLRRQGQSQVRQQVVTPWGKVVARSAGLTAEADIGISDKTLRLLVHSGRATVNTGSGRIEVAAGQLLELGPGQSERQPRNLPLPALRLQPGKRVQVFFDRQVPALGFLGGNRAAGATLELSRSARFGELLLREPLLGSSFGYRLLGPGRFAWRLVGSDGQISPVGKLSLQRDPLLATGRAASLINEVPDTGVETRIFFQGTAPALRFTWSAKPQAASYRFALYHEDRLEHPLLTKEVTAASLQLRAGSLHEGTYYWYQAALARDGKVLAKSQMNKLSLVFDNAALLLRIDSPRPGQKPRGGVVPIRGVASTGSRLTANGRRVELDASGRFNQVLDGVRPGGVVLFRLVRDDIPDTYFVRHLGR